MNAAALLATPFTPTNHRDTEAQRFGFLCVSVPLWPVAVAGVPLMVTVLLSLGLRS